MSLPLLFLLISGAVILFGMWRRFGAVQWIWVLFGAAMFMVLLWLLLIVLVVEPEMRKLGPAAG
jgi:hypothetical protein